jgi:mono/diheme cytochrome c family protein
MQRPQHHEDIRDHRARPRVRDLPVARGGAAEGGRLATHPAVDLTRALVSTAALAAAALLAVGCGAVGRVTATGGDASRGKALFVDPQVRCSSCHTLADAKAQGTIGPNLDDAFGSDKEQGFSEQTIRDIVRGQIAYPEEPMPANLVRGQDARDVAVYVAKCAGNASCGVTAASLTPPATTTTGGTTTAPAGGGGGSPLAAGKKVFTTAGCSSCHTLKDAGAKGTVGPDLDQLKPPKSIVAHQVEVGGGAMPAFKGRLSPAQIDAVATYVAKVAGK